MSFENFIFYTKLKYSNFSIFVEFWALLLPSISFPFFLCVFPSFCGQWTRVNFWRCCVPLESLAIFAFHLLNFLSYFGRDFSGDRVSDASGLRRKFLSFLCGTHTQFVVFWNGTEKQKFKHRCEISFSGKLVNKFPRSFGGPRESSSKFLGKSRDSH